MLTANTTDLSMLKNKRIMFIGDSLTRYQYLNLIRYIHFGRWTEPMGVKLCCEKNLGNWDDYFAHTSAYFGCTHICDCHWWPIENNTFSGTQENHYNYDPDLNLTISEHTWFGIVPMWLGTYSLMPTGAQFVQHCLNFTTAFSEGRVATEIPPRWSYPDINAFLEGVVKPSQVDVLIANFGHWEGVYRIKGVFKTEAKVSRFCELATSMVPLVIWKTTTVKLDHDRVDNNYFLGLLKRYPTIKIYDAYNMTADIENHKGAMVTKGAIVEHLHLNTYSFIRAS